jgi:hypothetical protein
MELAAPPGSEWCGDKERSQGGEMGTLSGGDSASRRNYGGGNMSGLPDKPLRKGAMVCPYAPYCVIGRLSTGVERFVCDAEKMAWKQTKSVASAGVIPHERQCRIRRRRNG